MSGTNTIDARVATSATLASSDSIRAIVDVPLDGGAQYAITSATTQSYGMPASCAAMPSATGHAIIVAAGSSSDTAGRRATRVPRAPTQQRAEHEQEHGDGHQRPRESRERRHQQPEPTPHASTVGPRRTSAAISVRTGEPRDDGGRSYAGQAEKGMRIPRERAVGQRVSARLIRIFGEVK